MTTSGIAPTQRAIVLARKLWTTLTKPGLLGRLSHGRGGRAAFVLIGVFLAPVVVCGAIWLLGLIPIFEHARWIPITLCSIVMAVTILPLFLLFGFWGTGANSGQDGGDQFGDFRPLVAFGLGWLRWLMQLVLVGGCMLALFGVCTDVRPWRFFSTPEIEALPARAASMPVGAGWTPRSADTGDDGENPYPNGYYERSFDVPAGYTFARMRRWMSGPQWANGFGALQVPHCDSDTHHCAAQVKPPPGARPQYTVDAQFDPASYEGDVPEVDLRLTYAQYVPSEAPDADVSQETRDRAALIPIPAGWSRYDLDAETTDNGENYTQYYDVPESFTRTDLNAWLTGPAWTHPATGKAFGEITMDDPCRKIADHYLCSMIVTATERTDPADDDQPVESLLVSFEPGDHQVTVAFERNG